MERNSHQVKGSSGLNAMGVAFVKNLLDVREVIGRTIYGGGLNVQRSDRAMRNSKEGKLSKGTDQE